MQILREIVSRGLWFGTAVCAVLSVAGAAIANMTPGISAPQQAAVAGGALVWIIAPYVVARGFDEVTRPMPRTAEAPAAAELRQAS